MLKVVVIDANAISRNLLTSVLVNGGYDVIGDSNLTSAGLANMIKLQPQLVCIDIGEADAEGLRNLEAIRTGLPKALIFYVSSHLDPAAIQFGLKNGVHGFIVKPFNSVTVLKSIRATILKLAQQHRQAKPADDAPAE
jgi:DNA-binding NarL/FixJ family response regulator